LPDTFPVAPPPTSGIDLMKPGVAFISIMARTAKLSATKPLPPASQATLPSPAQRSGPATARPAVDPIPSPSAPTSALLPYAQMAPAVLAGSSTPSTPTSVDMA
jgi:hypothetical protein